MWLTERRPEPLDFPPRGAPVYVRTLSNHFVGVGSASLQCVSVLALWRELPRYYCVVSCISVGNTRFQSTQETMESPGVVKGTMEV